MFQKIAPILFIAAVALGSLWLVSKFLPGVRNTILGAPTSAPE